MAIFPYITEIISNISLFIGKILSLIFGSKVNFCSFDSRQEFLHLNRSSNVYCRHSSDDNYDNLGLIISPMSTWNLVGEKWILSFSREISRAPPHREGGTCRSHGRDLHVFLFSSLTHTLYPPPLLFFLKTTQEEINHEGKTQLHPLAAGHSSYFVWNWLSESRRPARGAGTWYERNLRMKQRGLISSLHIPHSVSTVQLQSNTPLSWIDKRNWIPS